MKSSWTSLPSRRLHNSNRNVDDLGGLEEAHDLDEKGAPEEGAPAADR